MLTLTRTVGVAPGTTVLTLGGAVACQPAPTPADTDTVHDDGTPLIVYGDEARLWGGQNGLGAILNPPEVVRTLPGGPPYYASDAQYDTGRAEPTLYPDTAFGAVPTDDDLSVYGCYTPVHSGWVAVQKQAVAQKQALAAATFAGALAEATMSRYETLNIILGVVSTVALSTLAVVKIYSAVRNRKAR